uniref:LIM domain only 4a n=1 Tax=Cyprinus carpio carpio TaxID=630221 RepID=A0A9J7Z0H9_CYPCA
HESDGCSGALLKRGAILKFVGTRDTRIIKSAFSSTIFLVDENKIHIQKQPVSHCLSPHNNFESDPTTFLTSVQTPYKKRLFGHSGACSACGQSIPASEMVMRAQGNVYHLKCFTCATCRNRLVPGDRFHYVNGTIFCEHDRPGGALLSSHLTPLQSNTLLPDQKVC